MEVRACMRYLVANPQPSFATPTSKIETIPSCRKLANERASVFQRFADGIADERALERGRCTLTATMRFNSESIAWNTSPNAPSPTFLSTWYRPKLSRAESTTGDEGWF